MLKVEITFQKHTGPPGPASDGARHLHSLFISANGTNWGELAHFDCWVDHDPNFFIFKTDPHTTVLHNPNDGPIELIYKCLRSLKKQVGTLGEKQMSTL